MIPVDQGFGAMGKPVPPHRLAAALRHLRGMIPDIPTDEAMTLIGRAANHLERDRPYECQSFLMHGKDGATKWNDVERWRLDLTGAYRLMAVLLCDDFPAKEDVQ